MTERPDFEGEGLLEGLESDEERTARIKLVNRLLESGCTVEELKEAAAADRLALLPAERILTEDLRYTLEEAIEITGMDPGFARRDIIALGLTLPEQGQKAYSEHDLESWRMLKQMLEAGVSEEGSLELARVIGRSAAQAAEAILRAVRQAVIQPGDTEHDLAIRLADAATNLSPLLGPLVQAPVRMHIRDSVRAEMIRRAEIETGRLPDSEPLSVSFADLVDFTRFGERGSIQDVGQVVGLLTELAADAARPPVRLVKMIGDAAMMVSRDTDALLDATLTLIEAAAAESSLPELRAGINHGPTLSQGGDYYGSTVNLASRIAGVAPEGSLAATEAVRDAAAGKFRFKPLPPERLKGIEHEVSLTQVTRKS